MVRRHRAMGSPIDGAEELLAEVAVDSIRHGPNRGIGRPEERVREDSALAVGPVRLVLDRVDDDHTETRVDHLLEGLLNAGRAPRRKDRPDPFEGLLLRGRKSVRLLYLEGRVARVVFEKSRAGRAP